VNSSSQIEDAHHDDEADDGESMTRLLFLLLFMGSKEGDRSATQRN
jgi:hypothetical protein